MRRLLVGACAAALLGLAPAAQAAGVSAVDGKLLVGAGPETDTITVTLVDSFVTRVEDATAPLAAHLGCVQVDPHVATCAAGAFGIVAINLGDGNDTATVTGGGLVSVDGGDGDDTISVVDPFISASVSGGRGDDHLQLASFDGGTLSGDGGDDTLDVTTDWAELDGGPGDDLLLGGPLADAISPGTGNDRVEGRGGDDVIASDAGADDISGGDGRDTMIYDGGNIDVSLDDVADDGSPGEGDNVRSDVENVRAEMVSSAVLVGDDDANRLTCWAGCTIDGAGGNDVLGAITSGTVDGGEGDDALQLWVPYSSGNVDLRGGPGTDLVTEMQSSSRDRVSISLDDEPNDGLTPTGRANVHSDVENVTGGLGDDTLIGDDGPNVFHGGPGSDLLRPGGGPDTVDGDDGQDMVSYAGWTQGVHVTLDGVADDGAPGEGDNVFPDVEMVWGTDENDEIRAGGGLHNVTLVGRAGDDVLAGGPGDDDLEGDAGSDILSGGIGEDRADFLDHDGPVTVTLDGLRNDGAPGENDWVLADVEDIGGTSYDDTLVGNDGANVIDGWGGDDVIDLGGGADSGNGGLGDDTISAVDGVADRVFCDTGNDRAAVDSIDVVTACEAVSVTTPPAAPPAAPPPAPAPPSQPAPPAPQAPPVTPLPTAAVPSARLSHVSLHTRSTLVVSIGCPNTRWGTCRGTIAVTSSDRHAHALGHASFSVPAGKTRTLRIAIPRPARQALAHRTTLHAVLRATVRGNGHARTVVRRVTLHLG